MRLTKNRRAQTLPVWERLFVLTALKLNQLLINNGKPPLWAFSQLYLDSYS
jgi:hypothetical protein